MNGTIKRTISVAGILAASTAALADPGIKTPAQALDQLTGAKQTKEHSMCLAVTPYFLTGRGPNGVVSHFHSLLIDGVSSFAQNKDGDCREPDVDTGECERGYVKITSTAPIACNVPVAL